ncbi:MAG: hypothetical protein R3B90_11675 [Planctomycetaceae bacterium]
MSILFPERLHEADLRTRQLERLQELLHNVLNTNPFWQRKYHVLGIHAEQIDSLDTFRQLPFSTKQELVTDQLDHPPYGSNLSFPLGAYTRLHQTSGTTGTPMRWLDTPSSWEWLMSCWGQMFRIAGLQPDDVLAFPFSFGPFIGFWAGFEGAERQGNRVLPMGGMSSEARLRMLVDLGATWMCCTPTYAMRLAEVAAQMGLDLQKSNVRRILVAGEPGGTFRRFVSGSKLPGGGSHRPLGDDGCRCAWHRT